MEITLDRTDTGPAAVDTGDAFVDRVVRQLFYRAGLHGVVTAEGAAWRAVGSGIGTALAKLAPPQSGAAALGMIDGSSAEVAVESGTGTLILESSGGVDLGWFLDLRCEQLQSGQPLVDLMHGLTHALRTDLRVLIVNVEDPHHAWEAVFRALGTALAKLCKAAPPGVEALQNAFPAAVLPDQALRIEPYGRPPPSSPCSCGESRAAVAIEIPPNSASRFRIEAHRSVQERLVGVPALLALLADAAGIGIQIDFGGPTLASSHIALERLGQTCGRALLELANRRAQHCGINGAGSNLELPQDLDDKRVTVGLSIEGRKYWRLVPFDGDHRRLRERFLIGASVLGVRTEDLDDFIDGLACGLNACIMLHVKDCADAVQTWREIFAGIGAALREALNASPHRMGTAHDAHGADPHWGALPAPAA